MSEHYDLRLLLSTHELLSSMYFGVDHANSQWFQVILKQNVFEPCSNKAKKFSVIDQDVACLHLS